MRRRLQGVGHRNIRFIYWVRHNAFIVGPSSEIPNVNTTKPTQLVKHCLRCGCHCAADQHKEGQDAHSGKAGYRRGRPSNCDRHASKRAKTKPRETTKSSSTPPIAALCLCLCNASPRSFAFAFPRVNITYLEHAPSSLCLVRIRRSRLDQAHIDGANFPPRLSHTKHSQCKQSGPDRLIKLRKHRE